MAARTGAESASFLVRIPRDGRCSVCTRLACVVRCGCESTRCSAPCEAHLSYAAAVLRRPLLGTPMDTLAVPVHVPGPVRLRSYQRTIDGWAGRDEIGGHQARPRWKRLHYAGPLIAGIMNVKVDGSNSHASNTSIVRPFIVPGGPSCLCSAGRDG
ncbi:hypothetical protein BDP81DRAFT_89319 [Colletotrichum phormii]|uniref:Uncharacterized protein n=1 Tax=Colletotrichum phormii TaxID=359342 RepID=A0AAJ0A4A7_9PEZI|nr:uncharacterized protein BDP81DRAFT_89319 [Colletotrichum phormii]KAK1654821.1 hypothetical protein BDP81DRAFT_89319 [Colletotrichum phormii]